MTKPTLLLDVDGVLNPLGTEVHEDFEVLKDVLGMWRTQAAVYHSKLNHDRLALLASRFDLVWCTGWEDKANEIIGPVHGLPELPVIRFEPMILGDAEISTEEFGHSSWKLPWIAAWVKANDVGPLAWVDDQIEEGDRVWAGRRTGAGVPTFCVRPNAADGLTDVHVRHLLQWAWVLEAAPVE